MSVLLFSKNWNVSEKIPKRKCVTCERTLPECQFMISKLGNLKSKCVECEVNPDNEFVKAKRRRTNATSKKYRDKLKQELRMRHNPRSSLGRKTND